MPHTQTRTVFPTASDFFRKIVYTKKILHGSDVSVHPKTAHWKVSRVASPASTRILLHLFANQMFWKQKFVPPAIRYRSVFMTSLGSFMVLWYNFGCIGLEMPMALPSRKVFGEDFTILLLLVRFCQNCPHRMVCSEHLITGNKQFFFKTPDRYISTRKTHPFSFCYLNTSI